jgi:hypothetical protein
LPRSTRPSGSRGRRSSAFVREDSGRRAALPSLWIASRRTSRAVPQSAGTSRPSATPAANPRPRARSARRRRERGPGGQAATSPQLWGETVDDILVSSRARRLRARAFDTQRPLAAASRPRVAAGRTDARNGRPGSRVARGSSPELCGDARADRSRSHALAGRFDVDTPLTQVRRGPSRSRHDLEILVGRRRGVGTARRLWALPRSGTAAEAVKVKSHCIGTDCGPARSAKRPIALGESQPLGNSIRRRAEQRLPANDLPRGRTRTGG